MAQTLCCRQAVKRRGWSYYSTTLVLCFKPLFPFNATMHIPQNVVLIRSPALFMHFVVPGQGLSFRQAGLSEE